MDSRQFASDLIEFIDGSPTSYQAVEEIERRLVKNGFAQLVETEKWTLESEKKYFVKLNDSAIISFVVGRDSIVDTGFRLLGAHTDSPTFKIKPNAAMVKDGYIVLNTEVYGGPILSTWFDRPLSIAGRVMVKGADALRPEAKMMCIDKDLLIIPNLAIHMNREVNNGYSYNAQKDTLPLIAIAGDVEAENYIENIIASELNVKVEDVLDYDLYLYDRQKGTFLGLEEEFISIGRIDNLAMVHASLEALIDVDSPSATTMAAHFDNEEVGSGTVQGASSVEFGNILRRITIAMGLDEEEHLIAIANSFMISADMAHSVHPNYGDKADPTNRPVMGEGPVIKLSAKKSYATDGYSGAIFKAILKNANIPYQEFTNRSDAKGGSTIGTIIESFTGIKNIDVGNPMLAMHSVRELAEVEDHANMYRAFVEFLKI